jgi:hypothetical protein
MKSSKSLLLLLAAAVLALTPALPCHAQQAGPGMPRSEREQIHALFENHASIRRDVQRTADGYTALTESDDPKVAAALRKHVQQMEERFASGLSVRRWDPAFAEYAAHYGDMLHQFTPTKKGVRMTVQGNTPDAIKVARNHAEIISAFVAHGWTEQPKKHDPVAR